MDYWIPVGTGPSGCGVVVIEAVLTPTDVDQLGRSARGLQAAVPDSELLVVVVGHVAEELSAELAQTSGSQPISYERPGFEEELLAALKAAIGRLEQLGGDDRLIVVRERVERMSRQLSNTQSTVEQIAGLLNELRIQFGQERREIRELITSAVVGADGPAEGVIAAPSRLPAAVAELFYEALLACEPLNHVDDALRAAYAEHADGGRAADRRLAIRASLRRREIFPAFGMGTLTRRLVIAFRDAVEEWYRSIEPGPATANDEDHLSTICQTYDAIYEYLPLSWPRTVWEFATPLAGQSAQPDAGNARDEGNRVRELFDGLGLRVRRAVLAAEDPSQG